MQNDYVIEMLNIRKEFPGIVANDDITLQLRIILQDIMHKRSLPLNLLITGASGLY